MKASVEQTTVSDAAKMQKAPSLLFNLPLRSCFRARLLFAVADGPLKETFVI